MVGRQDSLHSDKGRVFYFKKQIGVFMAKRFTDTEKWKDPWFQDLPIKYKCLWFYILDQCTCAGIWKVNIRLASFQIGESFEESEIKRIFKDRIIDLGDGKWFLSKFITFQYGILSENCKPHLAVIKELNEHDLFKGYSKGMDTLKDKDKDKEKEVVKEKKKEKTEFGNVLDEFYKMRKSIKKPMTDRAKKMLFNQLDKLADNDEQLKIKILEQSIFHNWQGVFPLNNNNSNTQKSNMQKNWEQFEASL